MLSDKQRTLIYKDVREVVGNRRIFSVMWIIPLMFAVVLPLIMLLAFTFAPQSEMQDFEGMLRLLPAGLLEEDIGRTVMRMTLQYMFPMFFLMIPVMAASVMASSSFVGEKERRTLETLLYSPLTVHQVFVAKVTAAFLVSQLVSLISFAVLVAVTMTGTHLLMGGAMGPGWTWLPLMLVASPAIALMGIILTVRMSVKAQTSEEAQQRAAFLVLPLVLLAISQMAGLFLMQWWMLLALGAGVGVLDALLLAGTARKFQPEAILR